MDCFYILNKIQSCTEFIIALNAFQFFLSLFTTTNFIVIYEATSILCGKAAAIAEKFYNPKMLLLDMPPHRSY